MKAHELKEELRKGKYLVAAFGNVSLWKGTDREMTIHPNVFHALIKEDVLHEECIQCGVSEFTLKTPTEKEILEARVKELEEEIKLWHDTLDSTCHVMHLMEKIIKESNDE